MKKICVFIGANLGKDQIYYHSAIALGKELANRDITLVYGGGRLGQKKKNDGRIS